MLAPGALQALNVGRVRPVAFRTGSSRPASPSEAMTLRLIAGLMALRTGSWLVGHLFRFGIRLLVPPGASQKWWNEGLVSTKSFCRPGMKLPVQSIAPEKSADSAPVFEV